MRIIPKKIKVKNTVWKCYSMADVIVALVVLAIIFVAITSGSYAFAVIMGLIAVVMFMPTQDGIFYSCILENIKFYRNMVFCFRFVRCRTLQDQCSVRMASNDI